jgi:uncharacterized membrane protein
MTAFHALLALHIGGGGVALLAGPVPMLSRKGSPVHRKAGKVYAVAMLVASISAFVLAAITGNILLLGLAVFTFFLIFGGVRASGFRRGGRPVLLDQSVCVLTIGFSAWLMTAFFRWALKDTEAIARSLSYYTRTFAAAG